MEKPNRRKRKRSSSKIRTGSGTLLQLAPPRLLPGPAVGIATASTQKKFAFITKHFVSVTNFKGILNSIGIL